MPMDDEERRRQVKEMQTRIAETLIASAGEPRRRQEVLDHPGEVFTRPDGAPLAEGTPRMEELRRQLASGLMDRVARDPQFATTMRQDLFQAIRTAGLTPQIEQLRAETPVSAEVTGFIWGDPWGWIWGWLAGWR